MKINTYINKKGIKIVYGNGSHEEVDSLNKVNSFNEALKVMEFLRRRKEGLFGIHFGNSVDRTVYGKRKNPR